jgi:hypothetical protein
MLFSSFYEMEPAHQTIFIIDMLLWYNRFVGKRPIAFTFPINRGSILDHSSQPF